MSGTSPGDGVGKSVEDPRRVAPPTSEESARLPVADSFPEIPSMLVSDDYRLKSLGGSLDAIVNPPAVGEMITSREAMFPTIRDCHQQIIQLAIDAKGDETATAQVETLAKMLVRGIEYAVSDFRWIVRDSGLPLPPDFGSRTYFSIGAAVVMEGKQFLSELAEHGIELPQKAINFDALVTRAESRIASQRPHDAAEWLERCYDFYCQAAEK